MTIQFEPMSNDLYQIPKAQILFKAEGDDNFQLLGDADDVTVEPKVEKTERYSNESGTRILTATIVTQVGAELKMTLVQFSELNRAMSLLGMLTYDTQSAVPDHTMSLTAPEHGGKIYKLDHFDIDPDTVVVTDGAGSPVPYVVEVNYKIDTEAGFIQLLLAPETADGDVEITYDALVITAEDVRAKFGIASDTLFRGTVVIRGTNDIGPRTYLQLHNVQMTPSSPRAFISATDLSQIEMTGSVLRDNTQPAGYELGFERTLAAGNVDGS